MMRSSTPDKALNMSTPRWRRVLILGVVVSAAMGLVWRAADLQVLNSEFLQKQGDARHLRISSLSAHRGVIEDRNQQPLAISTPVDSIWAVPEHVLAAGDEAIGHLAAVLEVDAAKLTARLHTYENKQFLYLRRRMIPVDAAQVLALGVKGVHSQREYRRYYPAGEVTAHLVGFTNIDDQGQEALELAYDEWLQGIPGKKRVLKDRVGRPVKSVELIQEPQPGQTLGLTIDKRIQYLAYRELKAAVIEHRAKGGSVVVLDAASGEVLALVNSPSFNPNNRRGLQPFKLRNKAVVDTFEPGSTIKPFTVLAGLESGKYSPATKINTAPGLYRVSGHTISDVRNYGTIDVRTVIKKSSNIGVAKIALSLEKQQLAQVLIGAGFGEASGSGFPGESAGRMRPYNTWRRLDVATLAFGYGITVTPLQLARAYAVLATGGVRYPVVLVRGDDTDGTVAGQRVFDAGATHKVVRMMEGVIKKGGTATKAAVEHYRVAGKTGTVKKSISGGYADDRYVAVFAGITPVEGRSLVAVVMIDEPRGDQYYGGLVAAPVFSKVMTGALRILNIPPDGDSPPRTAASHKSQKQKEPHV